jgi:sulfur dioxygenase
MADRQTDLFFSQTLDPETCTYTYLLADLKSKEAVLIDTVLEMADRDLKILNDQGFRLKYILETHIHADHITGAAKLKESTGAKTVLSAAAKVPCADISLQDGEELQFGSFRIKAIATPGHTDSCMSFYLPGMVFTGDSLMISSAGRTDFQKGSAERLYHSITQKLYQLPNDTQVYPGHDYKRRSSSSIAEEKKNNERIGEGRKLQEFIQIMNGLKLCAPKKIQVAVPANMACGQLPPD